MEPVTSSSSDPVATDTPATENISIPGNKETSPLSSGVEATSKKRHLEEDISAEQGSVVGASVGSSVTPSPRPQTSLLPHKKRRLDEEPSGSSSGEVGDGVDDDRGDASISSIAVVAPATATTVPPVSTPIPTQMSPSTPHVTSVQVSTPAADPCTEISSGSPDLDVLAPPLPQIKEKDANIRPSKKARLDIEPTAASPIPSTSSTLESTESLAVINSNADTILQMDGLPKPCPFVVLPVELLSEMLIYTGSPQHVLAVARTCKALCRTLLSTNNQFIWREARRTCAFNLAAGPVYLPDPPEDFFGEAAYAAFMFDSGACEVCEKETHMMYTSFALRARLCKDIKCHKHFCGTAIGPQAPKDPRARVVPVIESSACLAKVCEENRLIFYPSSILETQYRISDWQGARAWIENGIEETRVENARIENTPNVRVLDDAFLKKYQRACERKIKWMEFSVSLQKWKFARQVQYHYTKKFNESQSKIFASKFGWDCSDLINSTVYGLYHKQKIKVIEVVRETDVRVMTDQIESQLLSLSERRGRHAVEVAYLNNRRDVETLYNSIRSSKEYPVLPSLASFRQLPVISLLQSASAKKDITITRTLQSNSLMHTLLSDQLKQWVEAAREDFAVLLGFPKKWKNANKNVLHPVERATARFQCVRCGTKAKDRGKSTNDGCLDFAAACRHVCNVGHGRTMKGKKGRWDVNNFVKDEKAIRVMHKIIQELNYDEDRSGVFYAIALGLAVLCTSCDPPMVLDSRSVVGHCHRHDAMEFSMSSSVDTITSYLGGYLFPFGLAEKLMGSEGLTVKGKKAIESKNYGCRHCLRTKQTEPAAAENENERGGGQEAGNHEPLGPVQLDLLTTALRLHDRGLEGPEERPPPLFNFNGMRSHLKAKHHIEMIRDEDFLCYDTIDL